MWRLLVSSSFILFASVIVFYIRRNQYKFSVTGKGHTAPGWREVGLAFRKNVESGLERGGAFVVYHRGEIVAEFYTGYADPDAGVKWNEDTLTLTYSCTKGVAAIVIAHMVERNLLEYDRPVSFYWPEFKQHGKENITIKQLLSHQAGLPATQDPVSIELLKNDSDRLGNILANQKPLWNPGTAIGYHIFTIGLYLDQIMRRVDKMHRSLSGYFNDEIALKHGIDYFIGLPREENFRCSREQLSSLDEYFYKYLRSWKFTKALLDPSSLLSKSMHTIKEYNSKFQININPNIRELPNPSNLGFGTASSLAKLYSLLATGKIVSADVLKSLSIVLVEGEDLVLLTNVSYSNGMRIMRSPLGDALIGTPGFGGQMAYADPKNELSWAYLTNYIGTYENGDDPRYLNLYEAMYKCLYEINKHSI